MARYIKVEDIYNCLNEVMDCKDKQYAISLLDWAIGKRTIAEDVIPAPKGATNGDIVKAMFPNEEFKQGEDGISKLFMKMNMDDVGYASLYKSWWNAPYQKGTEE